MTKNGPWNVMPTAKNLAVRARSYAGITPELLLHRRGRAESTGRRGRRIR